MEMLMLTAVTVTTSDPVCVCVGGWTLKQMKKNYRINTSNFVYEIASMAVGFFTNLKLSFGHKCLREINELLD